MFQRIELQTGTPDGWLLPRLLLLAWGGAAILGSASAWPWAALAMLALLLVDRIVARCAKRQHRPGSATLDLDGVLRLRREGREQVANWTGHAWVGRRFCVVHWNSPVAPNRGHTLVRAGDNHPDDYRRLRVLLRLGGSEAAR